MRIYGDEMESVVGQIDPFPLGRARIEPAEDVELPLRWVVLIGTLDILTADRARADGASRLLSAFGHGLELARAAGASRILSPVQRGGARVDWQRAFGVMVQAAERGPGELCIAEKQPEYFQNLAEIAPSFGVGVKPAE